MAKELRKSGIEPLGEIPWGTHICHFYETKKDFVELVTAYFKAGLENNEYCIWACSNPFNIERVMQSLKYAVPDFEDLLKRKCFEIVSITDGYVNDGTFNSKKINNDWILRLEAALERGFAGIRIHGNKGWLEQEDWEDFQEYEKELSSSINGKRIIVLCTYPLLKTDASTFFDVIDVHGCVVSTRKRKLEVLRDAEIKEIEAELRKRNQELEVLVNRRTQKLEKIIKKLEKEIAERKKIEVQLEGEKELSKTITESFPGVFTIVDKNYKILEWNEMFETLSGYSAEEISNLSSASELYGSTDKEKTHALFETAFATGKVSDEVALRKKNGRIVHFYFAGHQVNYKEKSCLICCGIDITERKKAEARFIREKELSNEIIDSIPGLVALFDQNMKFLLWNKAFEIASGYTPEEIRDLHGVESFYDNDHDKKVTTEILKEMLAKGFGSAEVSPLMKDGSVKTLFFNGRRIDYEGKICLLVIGIDISDRKMAEEKLRQSEILLAEAEHLAQVGSWSMDLRSQVVTWSEELYNIFRIQKSEFDHTLPTVIGFSHPEDKDFVQQMVDNAVRTCRPYNFYYRILPSSGDERILHVQGDVMTDEQGNAVRIYGAVQDVTESKRAEEELDLAYKRLSYHVANTPLAVVELDKNLFITRWSRQAENILGWNASEAIGKNMFDRTFSIIHEEDVELLKEVSNKFSKGLLDRKVIINRNITKNGATIYCEWYISALRDDHGNLITVLLLADDITERKRTEETLQQSYNEIRSLSTHLQNIREEERKHIAREIHDELGQKLTVLKMDVSWLNKSMSAVNNVIKQKLDDVKNLLDTTMQSVKRIATELRPSLLDDLGLVAALEWHLKEFEKRSGIKTFFNHPKAELQLNDEAKTGIYRISQESLTNVARHSKADQVTIDLNEYDRQLLLRIHDNGIGFDKQKAAHGKTLGILGMKERADSLGWQYQIQSKPGKGTTVLVEVPYSKNNHD